MPRPFFVPSATPKPPEMDPNFANGRYKIIKQIGHGSFGRVFEAVDTVTGQHVAVKFEDVDQHGRDWQRQGIREEDVGVKLEARLYEILKGEAGIPGVHYCGQSESGRYNVLVMDLLGPSLGKLLRENGGFSLKTVTMLALQMVERLEQLHGKGWVHHDLTLDNFVMGTGPQADMVYLIDFGFASDLQFGSIQGDMELLGDVLKEALDGVPVKTGGSGFNSKEMSTSTGKRKKYPKEFQDYFNYSVILGAKQKPNYEYVKGLFRQLLERLGYQNDKIFDWTEKNNEKEQEVKKGSKDKTGSGKKRTEKGGDDDNYVTRSGRVVKPLKRINF